MQGFPAFAVIKIIRPIQDVKKYLLVLVCMMAVIQQVGAQGNYARLYVGAVESQYQTWLWYDNPYYKDNTNLYNGRIS